jgi:hypothetical protein
MVPTCLPHFCVAKSVECEATDLELLTYLTYRLSLEMPPISKSIGFSEDHTVSNFRVEL